MRGGSFRSFLLLETHEPRSEPAGDLPISPRRQVFPTFFILNRQGETRAGFFEHERSETYGKTEAKGG